jgi:hypothetical protein
MQCPQGWEILINKRLRIPYRADYEGNRTDGRGCTGRISYLHQTGDLWGYRFALALYNPARLVNHCHQHTYQLHRHVDSLHG